MANEIVIKGPSDLREWIVLNASQEGLTANSHLRTYVFSPAQVASVDSFRIIPYIWQGIRIQHHVMDYPDPFIIYTLKNPAKVVEQILSSGFKPQKPSSIYGLSDIYPPDI